MRYQSRTYRAINRKLNESNQNKQNICVANLPINKVINLRDSLNISVRQISKTSKQISIKKSLQVDIKKYYSQLIAKQYSMDMITQMINKVQISKLNNFLNQHKITCMLRSKMIDWMIQVLGSYKMTQDTFFKSVIYMDTYFKNVKAKQELKDLHIIGVSSMFLASKYEEIYPFRLSCIYQKIARKKFTKQQILKKQSEIIETLNFQMEIVTIYDLVKHILHQIDLVLDNSMLKYFQDITLYLCKMVMFDTGLCQQKLTQLSGAVIFISLKTLEQMDKSIEPQKYLVDLTSFLRVNEEDMIEVSRRVLDLAKNFSKIYPNLTNLKKFNRFQYKIQ